MYRRFANRDDLVFGVFLEHLKSVVARTGEAIDDEDPWNAVVVDDLDVSGDVGGSGSGRDHHDDRPQQSRDRALKATLSERIEKIFDRAMAAGVLRPDLTPTDFYALFTMLKAVSEVTEQCAPGTWRRYLDLILDAVSAEPSRTTLGAPPMTPEQIREMQKAHKAGR